MAGTLRHPHFLFKKHFCKQGGFGMTVYFATLMLGLLVVGSASAQSASSNVAQQIETHERRAHELLSQKKPELAIKEFAAVVAIDPKNLDAQANLGVLLYFQQSYAEAEPHLRNAVEIQPSLANIRALLGMCERQLGKVDLARTDLETVVVQLKEPKILIESGLELIEIYTSAADLEDAARVVSILRKSAPTDPRILYTAYRIYTDLSSEALLDLSVVAPDSGQMHQAMAHELGRQGDLTAAIASYRAALAANAYLPGIHFELAEALNSTTESKLRVEAESEYKLAVAANNLDAKALTRLGDITTEKGDIDGAATYYRRALAVLPSDTDASIGLAHVYMQKNDAASALPLLEGAIAADPTNVMAHYRLSAVYRKLNRPEEAKEQVKEYQKYKEIKEKMRMIYKDLQVDAPQDGMGK
jgi:Tfp pilus assembly protein PilF